MENSPPCSEIIGDIEDLISSQDVTPKDRYRIKKNVTVRARRHRNVAEAVTSSDITTDSCESRSMIPGTQSIYIKTWGCTHNSSDSEYMAGQLAAYGYTLTDDKEKADLWLLNSCTVKTPAEDHFRNEIEAGNKKGKPIVVAGCVSQGAPKTQFIQGLSIIGVQQIDRVVEVVEETLKGNTVRLLGQKRMSGRKAGGAPLILPKVRRNPLIEIIPINTGCLNQCTYCKTKHARGELGSYPPEEIVNRAKQSFEEGVRELWLTSEDTGAYGRDIGTNLPELLWRLVDVVPEGCMMRVGMTNPPYILEHLEDMAEIFQHPRVYSFIHVPVQSGSDAVLADMKREYCRADFEKVVDFLKERVPRMTVATDVICGFPTETAQDFNETLTLCEKYKFPSLFINQYFPRPGTPAARLTRIPTQEVKRRTKELWELFQSYYPYNGREGEIHHILITEVSHDSKHYVGHTKAYEQVLVPHCPEMLGKMVTVKIVSTSKHSMNGVPLSGVDSWKSALLTPPLPPGEISGLHKDVKRPTQKFFLPWSMILLVVAVLVRFLWLIL